ncbi:MAG: ribonuclease PH [Elusimicrobiota bacterium]
MVANYNIRSLNIELNYVKHADGSCLISMGNTRVLCVATVEEEKLPPHCEAKGIGWITAEYAMLPRSGKQRTPRTKTISSGRTHEIQRLIGRSLRSVVNLRLLGKRTIIIDCDVILADGGTRTASINGAFIAMCLAIQSLLKEKKIIENPVKDYLGAVSVGIVGGKKVLDLSADEDNVAEVDMNVVMTGSGEYAEVQVTGEGRTFSLKELEDLLAIAKSGIKTIIERQKKIVKL